MIAQYGERWPKQFGGVLMRDGRHVVLFTADLDRHEQSLAQLLDPADFRVQLAERPWREILRVRDQVSQALISTEVGRQLGVNGVGIEVEDDQFRIVVSTKRVDDEVIPAIASAADPHQVSVKRGRHTRLV